MRISRFYTSVTLQSGHRAELADDAAHYLVNVLRLGQGATLVLFNGDGLEYSGTIETVGKHKVSILVGAAQQPQTESMLTTVLGLGISRGERMDYAIQKSTELGVSTIVPLFTEHCEVKLQGERLDKRQAHWQQIAISACEQCGRVKPPKVLAPTALTPWLASVQTSLKLVLDHTEQGSLSGPRPTEGVSLLIGPEGGLSVAEIAQAKATGFVGLGLGKRILRTETAPLVALSVLQYLWG